MELSGIDRSEMVQSILKGVDKSMLSFISLCFQSVCVQSVHACIGDMLHSTDWLPLQATRVSKDPVIFEIHLSWWRSRRNGRTPLMETVLTGSWRYNQNTAKFKSVEPVRKLWTGERVALETGRL